MSKTLTLTLLILSIMLPTQAVSATDETSETSLDTFGIIAKTQFILCRLQVKSGLMEGKPLKETMSCVENAKAEIKPIYIIAKKTLKSNVEATKALKSAYAYWLTLMGELLPDPNERKFSYELKLDKMEQELSMRINVLNLEAEL